MRIPTLLACVLLVAACGTRGPLTLPPKPQAPAATPPAAAADYGSKAPAGSAQ